LWITQKRKKTAAKITLKKGKSKMRKYFSIIILLFIVTSCGKEESNKNHINHDASISIVNIENDEKIPLNEKSIISVDLDYSIDSFKAGAYSVLAQFDTTEKNFTTDGDFPATDYPTLTKEKGRIHINFPVYYALNAKNISIPLKVRFFITRSTDPYTSIVVAQSKTLTFEVSK